MLLNGEYVVVEKVQHEILEAPITVYNFQVEDSHTYYVSGIGVLVHNKCGQAFDGNQQAVIALAKENRNGLSRSDAHILIEWANEYGINNHDPMIHPNRSGMWSQREHIKIFNIHVPII